MSDQRERTAYLVRPIVASGRGERRVDKLPHHPFVHVHRNFGI
ncbi:MAG: hypothetical protein HY929_06210 [Euryarchaeota archaeon]|nr:hypothetical protein [Euryarchaeota archaeon]